MPAQFIEPSGYHSMIFRRMLNLLDFAEDLLNIFRTNTRAGPDLVATWAPIDRVFRCFCCSARHALIEDPSRLQFNDTAKRSNPRISGLTAVGMVRLPSLQASDRDNERRGSLRQSPGFLDSKSFLLRTPAQLSILELVFQYLLFSFSPGYM